MNQAKFERLLTAAREREEARRQYRIELDAKYRTTYRDNWTRAERTRYDKLSDSAFAAIGKFTDALEEVSSRNWRAGVPVYWVLDNMTWKLATTRDALPIIPPAAWGSTTDNSRFAMAVS